MNENIEGFSNIDKFYKLFYIYNINNFQIDLLNCCKIFNYKYNIIKNKDIENYCIEYNIENIGKLNIYYDGTVKCIKFENKKLGIPIISKNLQDEFELNQMIFLIFIQN